MGRWGKQAAAATLGLAIVGGGTGGAAYAAPNAIQLTASGQTPIQVILDEVPLALGLSPVVLNGTTMVPFRGLADALGIRVTWDARTKSVNARADVDGAERNVVLRLGEKTAQVDGRPVPLLAAPLVVNEQVLVPLKFFGTQFGAQVAWNARTRTVTVVSPVKKLHLRAFYAMGSFAQRQRMDAMDSVAFGWARIDENGELTTSGKDYYWPEAAGEATPESLVHGLAGQGGEPYLMVYSVDGKGELTKMLGDEELRARSMDGIVALARNKGFAGVLLDYEGLGLRLDPEGQRKLLNDYARELDARLEAIGVKLSVAVPPLNGSFKGYDYKTLASYADDLVLMAYDYHPAGTPEHTPEPIAKVEQAIALAKEAGVPASKLVLGVSLWSETADSVDGKLGLAKRYGLKGASFWRLTFYGDEFARAIDRTVTKERD